MCSVLLEKVAKVASLGTVYGSTAAAGAALVGFLERVLRKADSIGAVFFNFNFWYLLYSFALKINLYDVTIAINHCCQLQIE